MSFAKSLQKKASKAWEVCYQHPFVQELGQGVLAQEKFQFYLVQDYKYLLEYARVFALGAFKAQDELTMTSFTLGQYAILHQEMNLHRAYMQEYGIQVDAAQKVPTALFNSAYTANMLTIGHKYGAVEIMAVVLPCAWSYYDFAQRLKKDYSGELLKNPYKSWLDMYTSQEYLDSFAWFFTALDEAAAHKSQTQLQKLEEIFCASVEFEYLFWEMAYKEQISF